MEILVPPLDQENGKADTFSGPRRAGPWFSNWTRFRRNGGGGARLRDAVLRGSIQTQRQPRTTGGRNLGLLVSRFFKVKRSPEAMELHGFIYGVELTIWLSVDADSQEWQCDRMTVQTPADLCWATTIPVKELASLIKKPNRRIALTNAWAALLHNEMLNLKSIQAKVNDMHAREGKEPLYDHEISLNTTVRDGLIKFGVSIRNTQRTEIPLRNLGFPTELRAIPFAKEYLLD